jgi:hypothetical protein
MNKNLGLPKGFEGNLVKQKFPAAKPIFWGPNQTTLYPGVYTEPSDWNHLEMMKIPAVVRFITGGNKVPAPIVNRRIYLGYSSQVVGSYYLDTFAPAIEIQTTYGANKTTAEVLAMAAAYSGYFVPTRTWYFYLFNSISGSLATQTNTLYWFFAAPGLDDPLSIIPPVPIFSDLFISLSGVILLP